MNKLEKQVEKDCKGKGVTYRMGYIEGYQKGIDFAKKLAAKL